MTTSPTYPRAGRFTSSGISALVKPGKGKAEFSADGLRYILDKRLERDISGPLEDSDAFNLAWGRVAERYAFDNILGPHYRLCHDQTIIHPLHDFWAGTPDAMTVDPETRQPDGGTVADIKCPATRKSYALFLSCTSIEDVVGVHPDGFDYFWQLVSNAALTGCKRCELIIFMPYASQLPAIRDYAAAMEDCEWISNRKRLPHIFDGIPNNLLFSWEVKQSDIEHLTSRIIAAEKMI